MKHGQLIEYNKINIFIQKFLKIFKNFKKVLKMLNMR